MHDFKKKLKELKHIIILNKTKNIIYPNTTHDMVVPTNAKVRIAPRFRKKNLCKTIEFKSSKDYIFKNGEHKVIKKIGIKYYYLFHVVTSKEYNGWKKSIKENLWVKNSLQQLK